MNKSIKNIIAIILVSGWAAFMASLCSFDNKKPEVVTNVSYNADYAKKYIDAMIKAGYRVISITPEPVSIATGSHSLQRQYGRFLIIMERQ